MAKIGGLGENAGQNDARSVGGAPALQMVEGAAEPRPAIDLARKLSDADGRQEAVEEGCEEFTDRARLRRDV